MVSQINGLLHRVARLKAKSKGLLRNRSVVIWLPGRSVPSALRDYFREHATFNVVLFDQAVLTLDRG